MKKVIEKEITKLLKELKPEFKDIVFIFNDKLVKENGKIQLAYCDHTVNPKLICFNTSSIEEMFRDRLKEIIRHEIAHIFTINEQEAKLRQASDLFDIF